MPNRQTVLDLVGDELFPLWEREYARLKVVDKWYRWQQDEVPMPKRTTSELRRLASLVKVPWLGLVVSTVAQALYVDGYRSESDTTREADELSAPWHTWNANNFDQRQTAVHRGALAYGYSFVTVMPGEDAQGKRSVLRGVSPRKMQAVYADAAEDDWPMYVIRVEPQKGGSYAVRVIDDEFVHYVGIESDGAKPTYISYEVHDTGFPPVVRFTNMLDLDGRCDGEVEPFIPIAARINKTNFDRLLTQHFSSWKIRTVAGMAAPDTEEETNRKKLELRQDDILVAEDPDTRFGTLDETSLDGFINAAKADVETLAAVTQTPTHSLTGQLVNVSGDALAMTRAGLTQKVTERQKSFGKSHVQVLQAAALQEGNLDEAEDVTARVTWQDMEIRSIGQAVDALGKAAQMLNVPPEVLWQRIPGVEKTDVDEWREFAERRDPINRMTDELIRQSTRAPREPAPAE